MFFYFFWRQGNSQGLVKQGDWYYVATDITVPRILFCVTIERIDRLTVAAAAAGAR
jgi:hypothetical protein